MGIIGVLAIACALAVKFNKKIEETLAPAILGCSILLYLSGRIISFTPGLVIIGAAAVAACVYCIWKLVKDRQAFSEAVFTWGGLALLIYMAFFAYYAFHRDFSHPDEMYCWGLLAKDFYTYGTLSGAEFTSFAADQAPLMSIWFYFGARTWLGFSDSICLFMHSILTISLVLPVFAHVRRRISAGRFWVILALLPSILIVSGLEGFQYALADIVLAAGLCFFLINTVGFIRSGDRFCYVSSVLMTVSMCLLKRIGPVFAALMLMSATYVCMRKSASYIRELGIAAVITVVAALSWFGLSVYCLLTVAAVAGAAVEYLVLSKASGFVETHRNLTGILAGLALLGGAGVIALGVLCQEGYGYSIVARFLEDLFSISAEDGYLQLSYGMFMLAVVAVMAILGTGVMRGAEVFDTDRRMYIDMGIQILISMALYAIVMLYMHIQQIGMYNDFRESLIPRYMIPWEVLALFYVIYILIIDYSDVKSYALVICLAVVLLISDSGEMYRGLFARHRFTGFYALSDAGVTLKSGDMIYYVDEEPSYDYSDREFYYHAAPARTNFIYNLFNGTNGVLELDADEWASELKGETDHYYPDAPGGFDNYDYVYIQSYASDFVDRYGVLFDDPGSIEPGTAYSVVREGDAVKLVKLERQ